MSQTQRETYARAVVAAVKDQKVKGEDMDPFTIVAIIHNESRWRASVVSSDGEDYGLGQIRGRFEKACRSDADPVHSPSPACLQAKKSLLNGTYNIKRVAHHIADWRRTCRKITGQPALFQRWLHGYGGMGKRNRATGRWKRICGQRPTKKGWVDLPVHRLLRRIINYRKMLIKKSNGLSLRRRN